MKRYAALGILVGSLLLPQLASADSLQKSIRPTVAGFVGLPLGDFGDFVDFGAGALGGLEISAANKVNLRGRAGLIYYATEGEGTSLISVPVWLGGQYFLAPGKTGIYVGGDLALNWNRAEVEVLGISATSSDTELGMNLVTGFAQGKLSIEGGLYINSLDDLSDSLVLGGSVGLKF